MLWPLGRIGKVDNLAIVGLSTINEKFLRTSIPFMPRNKHPEADYVKRASSSTFAATSTSSSQGDNTSASPPLDHALAALPLRSDWADAWIPKPGSNAPSNHITYHVLNTANGPRKYKGSSEALVLHNAATLPSHAYLLPKIWSVIDEAVARAYLLPLFNLPANFKWPRTLLPPFENEPSTDDGRRTNSCTLSKRQELGPEMIEKWVEVLRTRLDEFWGKGWRGKVRSGRGV